MDSGRTPSRRHVTGLRSTPDPHPCPDARLALWRAVLGLPEPLLRDLEEEEPTPRPLLELAEFGELENVFGQRAVRVWLGVVAGWILAERGRETTR